MNDAKNEISKRKTVCTFLKVGSCSETLCNVVNRAFDFPLKTEENATLPLAGGIIQHGYQCGMLWGAALAAGAQAYRLYGAGPQAETKAIIAAQKLVESFFAQNNTINCFEITDIDRSSSVLKMIFQFLIKGGTIGCIRRAANYGEVAVNEIKSALSENNEEVSCTPASCAAMLAKKLGLSDLHTVMVAGLAGGIGLCGGACGALGAAIWILTMQKSREGERKIEFNDPVCLDLIEKFLKRTDYEFECSDIVGWKFEDVDDHADYLDKGGCSELINLLAEEIESKVENRQMAVCQ